MGVPLNMASGPGAFFNSPQMPQHMAAAPPMQTARREMSGPSGVDDILKTFEEVRQAEGQGMNMPMQPPQSMNHASELQSLASEDMGSVTTDRTSGGRRRRRQAPIGNTVTINA